MPLNIIRNDITRVSADAIVNTANPQVAVGAGVDQAIYEAAGAEQLLAERAKIGPMQPGHAAVTPAFARGVTLQMSPSKRPQAAHDLLSCHRQQEHDECGSPLRRAGKD